MTDMLQFGMAVLLFLIDIFTLFLIAGVFYIIGLAIYTMASNRTPRWDSIFYVLFILLMAIWLVRWYPGQIITSVRVGMEDSRPEADLLRAEVQLWLPGLDQAVPQSSSTAVPPLPAATAPVVAVTAPPVPEETAVPLPATAVPTSIPLPTATPTIEATFDPYSWNPATPPPTPEPRR